EYRPGGSSSSGTSTVKSSLGVRSTRKGAASVPTTFDPSRERMIITYEGASSVHSGKSSKACFEVAPVRTSFSTGPKERMPVSGSLRTFSSLLHEVVIKAQALTHT